MLGDESTEVVLNPFAQWLQETGFQIGTFKACTYFEEGLALLVFITEDVSTTTVYVRNACFELLRHSYEPRNVAIQFWLGYNPHLLLPELR